MLLRHAGFHGPAQVRGLAIYPPVHVVLHRPHDGLGLQPELRPMGPEVRQERRHLFVVLDIHDRSPTPDGHLGGNPQLRHRCLEGRCPLGRRRHHLQVIRPPRGGHVASCQDRAAEQRARLAPHRGLQRRARQAHGVAPPARLRQQLWRQAQGFGQRERAPGDDGGRQLQPAVRSQGARQPGQLRAGLIGAFPRDSAEFGLHFARVRPARPHAHPPPAPA